MDPCSKFEYTGGVGYKTSLFIGGPEVAAYKAKFAKGLFPDFVVYRTSLKYMKT